MGIDWEGILDAEGADMADAYDALVFDAYEGEEYWDEEDIQYDEDVDEDSVELPLSGGDGTAPIFTGDVSLDEGDPYAADDMQTIQQQKRDIQKLIGILVENDIPIPGDIIDKYIKRSSTVSSEERPEDPKSSEINDGDLPF